MKTVGDVVVECRNIKEKFKYKKTIYVIIDDTGLGGGVTDRLNGGKVIWCSDCSG